MSSHVYNSVAQMRADAWCRLEDAAGQLVRLAAAGKPTDSHQGICADVLAQLEPIEPYWAYPGGAQVARIARIFAAGDYLKFAQAVTHVNHALSRETYRSGQSDMFDADDDDYFPAVAGRAEAAPGGKREPKYFEVLAVESLTEAQELSYARKFTAGAAPTTSSSMRW